MGFGSVTKRPFGSPGCCGISCASAELRDDKEVVLSSVLNGGLGGLPLFYASARLRNSIEKLVSRDGVSVRLKNDADIVKLALAHNKYALYGES